MLRSWKFLRPFYTRPSITLRRAIRAIRAIGWKENNNVIPNRELGWETRTGGEGNRSVFYGQFLLNTTTKLKSFETATVTQQNRFFFFFSLHVKRKNHSALTTYSRLIQRESYFSPAYSTASPQCVWHLLRCVELRRKVLASQLAHIYKCFSKETYAFRVRIKSVNASLYTFNAGPLSPTTFSVLNKIAQRCQIKNS